MNYSDESTVAGMQIAHNGKPGGAVTVVFKADEAQITADDVPRENVVTFDGQVEESFFSGNAYRYYVNVNGEMILVDTPTKVIDSKVHVSVPTEKIQVYNVHKA